MNGGKSGRTGALGIAVACAGLSLALAAPAPASAASLFSTKSKVIRSSADDATAVTAKKKKGKKAVNSTASAPAGFSAGTAAQATAECGGKTHLTGGGYAVAPSFTYTAGLRSQETISFPSGAKTWVAGGGAFTTPPASGSLTSFARCESSALGKVVATLSISGTVAPATTTTALIDCLPGTHVIGGGYSGTGLANFTTVSTATRNIILESRRTSTSQWSVVAYTNSSSPVPASFTAYALCEKNGKGTSVSEVPVTVPITENARAAAEPSCTGKKHVVSGGFAVTDVDPGNVVAAGIDENNPVGSKGWHVGMYEYSAALPAGSALSAIAYCKKNSPAKKGKKK